MLILETDSVHSALNVVRIAAWSDDIVEGNIKRIQALFKSYGSDETIVAWDRPVQELPPVLNELYEIWRGLAPEGQLPRVSQINPLILRPALGYIALLDPVDGGTDFRYRLYGSVIAAISGFDLTGKLQSEVPISAYVREFIIALDRAVFRQGRPLYASRNPVRAERVTTWHRLSLPLLDDDGRIARLLVGNVPIAASGHVLRV